MPTSAKKKMVDEITAEDIKVGIDAERETSKICASLLRRDVIHTLRDFLSEREATAYGPESRKGQPILKPDGSPFRMRDIEHALHLYWDETKELLTPDGSDKMRTEFGDTVPDGKILEITSGAEGVVQPTVWQPRPIISIHTHPTVPLDDEIREQMAELKKKGTDGMNVYNETDHSLADPHLLSNGDILAYLANKVRAGCLAEYRKNLAGEDEMVLKCYNLRCMYPSQQRRFARMSSALSNYEDSLRQARSAEFWGKRTPTASQLEWKVRQIEALMRTANFYNTNKEFSRFYYSKDCQCQFRFDPS